MKASKPIILVKLKMKKIYKSSLSLIAFLIIILSCIGISYLYYDKSILLDSDVEVNGALSINYVDGKKFNIEKKKTMTFSVSNASENVSYYNITFTKVRGDGLYKLFSEDTLVMEGTLRSIDELSTDYISIDARETKKYTIKVENTGTSNLKGTINIRVQNGKMTTFADTILQNVSVSENTLTKVGEEAATLDEGLIKSSDDIGVSYYFRGDVKNNYVKFADLNWRIVRINGDGTVRIILDDVADVLANYYNSNEIDNFSFENSNLNSYLDLWLQNNLNEYLNYIANSKFCSDINIDKNNNYMAYSRIITNKIPTLNCLGTPFGNNIGILTIDEVILAGASPSSNNQNFYLYNSKVNNSWYTMSAAKGSDNSINMFMIAKDGRILTDVNGNLYRDVRPVINLIKNIEVKGNGTKENPYEVVF